jgi:hypothetical protein
MSAALFEQRRRQEERISSPPKGRLTNMLGGRATTRLQMRTVQDSWKKVCSPSRTSLLENLFQPLTKQPRHHAQTDSSGDLGTGAQKTDEGSAPTGNPVPKEPKDHLKRQGGKCHTRNPSAKATQWRTRYHRHKRLDS